MRLIDVLPRSDRDGFEEYIVLLEGNMTSERLMRNLYGDEIVVTKIPLSDKLFNEIYEKSTPLWKTFWKHWKDEGLLN